jgi:ribosome-associated toxin RatA of RatAB toxin-antitoxin module
MRHDRAVASPGTGAMRILKTALITLMVVAAVIAAAGLFLPRSAHVERSIVIDAAPATVYNIVSDLRRFNEWSPWYDLDPAAKYEFSGPPSGVGSKMSWASAQSNVGSGSQEIVAAEDDRYVTTLLDFGPQGQAHATLEIEPEDSTSRVTWKFDTSFEDDYLGRYFGLMFDHMIGTDYEKGLVKLKALVEHA